MAADALALGPSSLVGVRVGVSVSESSELARLGLTDAHLKLALAEIARVVIRAGGTLVYGGHLQRDGYTAFLEGEVDRYGGTDRLLQLVVPWGEHRRMSLSELQARREALSLKGAFTYLDPSGRSIAADAQRGEQPAPVQDASVARSLTALREHLCAVTDARVLLGGKEDGYLGVAPGIIEEALLAIRAGQSIYAAGGFGGATATVAQVVCAVDDRWPPVQSTSDRWPAQLCESVETTGWSPDNGLDALENLQLAATHRPSEAASLIANGLARRFAAS